ncbi:MAG: UbiH/UbiF/VisC/COQ6 family ubiquinone biosynthesis hydroxylase [Gammaproteobacteria bacterium]|nr:UbiH/UbiF/VisC/COQ6 family ubiquinone biosynthesis hydroxylase [Gammaproteobacteria bacterium]
MSDGQYDVVIVGGGMVGAALACALGDSALKVAVVEGREPDLGWPREDYDIRVSAITRASQHLFENLGVWEGMCQRRVSAYTDMHVWDATGRGEIHFDSADIGEPDLGHIIENSVIQSVLLTRLAELENIDLLCPLSIESMEFDGRAYTLVAGDGRQLQARLLVGADGARSRVREQAGIAAKGWSYEQSAVVCTVTTAQSHRNTAWQRFMPSGPLAFLPLTENRSSIVWSTTPQQAEALLALDETAFCRALGEAFEFRLGEVTSTGPRGAFPLGLSHAEHYVQNGLALVGDAAHTIHPLAGQGVNLGLADAAALAEVLLEAHAARKDIGSLAVLRRYERWRRSENLAMMATMDGFKRLFSNNSAPLRWLRNLGLGLTNSLGPVKNSLMRQAMGLGMTQSRMTRRRRHG